MATAIIPKTNRVSIAPCTHVGLLRNNYITGDFKIMWLVGTSG